VRGGGKSLKVVGDADVKKGRGMNTEKQLGAESTFQKSKRVEVGHVLKR